LASSGTAVNAKGFGDELRKSSIDRARAEGEGEMSASRSTPRQWTAEEQKKLDEGRQDRL
jgi:hypothetical protein